MKKQQEIQESQYSFPYHYIPKLTENEFCQHRHWSWGYRYLGGMHVVKQLLNEESIQSLLDIGCGDGRFAAEIRRDFPDLKIKGIDYSERAINLARGFNPDIDYECVNILEHPNKNVQYDAVTLIEVLEHIPPDDLPKFLGECTDFLCPGGRLVLTVPHENKPLQHKHFQHFSEKKLTELLQKNFTDLKFKYFDPVHRVQNLWFRLLGGHGKYFIISWKPILYRFYNHYLRKALYADSEKKCFRIACSAKRK